ncbi:MAG: hypothetical protein IK024_01610 [Treponema sp.]|nr:hypothetical protein [Treponema sp.]
MIIQFLLSFAVITVVNVLCMLLSGGPWWGLVNGVELPGIIFILALVLFLSGYGKSFCIIFSSRSKLKKLSLDQLRQSEKSLDFAIRALLYICLFFMLVAASMFYINFDYRTTLGPNLATIIGSLHYMLYLDTILITIKSSLKKQIISFMTEEGEVLPVKKTSAKKVVLSILKTLCVLVVIIAVTWGVIFSHTANMQDNWKPSLLAFLDLPSVFYLIIGAVPLMLVSANFTVLVKALVAVFKNKKITVTEKNLYENAVSTLRQILLYIGVQGTLIGFISILMNLEDRSVLGLNMMVAAIVTYYAIIVCALLLVVESRIHNLCKE